MEAIRGGADKGTAGDTAVVRVDRKESRTDYARVALFLPFRFPFSASFSPHQLPQYEPSAKVPYVFNIGGFPLLAGKEVLIQRFNLSKDVALRRAAIKSYPVRG